MTDFPIFHADLWTDFFREAFSSQKPSDVELYAKLIKNHPTLFTSFRQRKDIGMNGQLDVAETVQNVIDVISPTGAWRETRPIFITGSAGTGKSMSIKMIRNECTKRDQEICIAAFTGSAAIQVDGTTLHSLLGLSPFTARVIHDAIRKENVWDRAIIRQLSKSRLETYDILFKDNIVVRGKEWTQKKVESYLRRSFNNLKNARALIVDEISMLGDTLLEILDVVLRFNKKRLDVAFGGLPVIMVGDFYQLPPVGAKRCFTSPSWLFANPIQILLDKPLRQIGDISWFHALEKIRLGDSISDCPSIAQRLTTLDCDILTAIKKRLPQNSQVWVTCPDIPVIMFGRRKKVEQINKDLFQLNPNPIEETLRATHTILVKTQRPKILSNGQVGYEVVIRVLHEGQAAEMYLNNVKNDPKIAKLLEAAEYDAPSVIELKKESQFIVLKNINKRICNGTTMIYDGARSFRLKNDAETVLLSRFKTSKTIKLDNDHYLKRDTWSLRLGYAVTIHASQGMTLDKAIVDITDSWMAGQTYVALSRVKSAEGLTLIGGGKHKKFKTPESVQSLYSKLQQSSIFDYCIEIDQVN